MKTEFAIYQIAHSAINTTFPSGMFGLLIKLIIVGLIFGFIWWAVDAVPQPFNRIIKVLSLLLVLVYLLSILLTLL